MGRSKLMNFCVPSIYHTCTYVPTTTNVFVFLFCRGWTYPEGVRNPNCLLGAVLKEHFPRLVQLPIEGRVPEPGLTWPHYNAASAPPDECINNVECCTRADMVVATFWVNIL